VLLSLDVVMCLWRCKCVSVSLWRPLVLRFSPSFVIRSFSFSLGLIWSLFHGGGLVVLYTLYVLFFLHSWFLLSGTCHVSSPVFLGGEDFGFRGAVRPPRTTEVRSSSRTRFTSPTHFCYVRKAALYNNQFPSWIFHLPSVPH